MSEFYRDSPAFERVLAEFGETLDPNELIITGRVVSLKSTADEVFRDISVFVGWTGESRSFDKSLANKAYDAIMSGVAIGHLCDGANVSKTVSNLNRFTVDAKFKGVSNDPTTPEEVAYGLIDYGLIALELSDDLEVLLDDGLAESLAENDIYNLLRAKSMIAIGYLWSRGIDLEEKSFQYRADKQASEILLNTDMDAELAELLGEEG